MSSTMVLIVLFLAACSQEEMPKLANDMFNASNSDLLLYGGSFMTSGKNTSGTVKVYVRIHVR